MEFQDVGEDDIFEIHTGDLNDQCFAREGVDRDLLVYLNWKYEFLNM